MPVQRRKRRRRRKPAQRYDSILKELVQERIAELVPLLLEGAVFVERLDVERIRPTMRIDSASLIEYEGEPHVLHLEFESSDDKHFGARLHTYHAILHQDYELPVITMVIYPFRVSELLTSPWYEKSLGRALVTFHFVVLPFYLMDAQSCVREHLECLYTLLPTMQGVTSQVIRDAMEEMTQIYENDEATLSRYYSWMRVFLDRSDTIAQAIKEEIDRKLSTYDHLWDENPRVQHDRAVSKAEGKAEGEIQTARQFVVTTIEARFPALVELAQQRIAQLDSAEKLTQLFRQLIAAPDEATARWALSDELPGENVGRG